MCNVLGGKALVIIEPGDLDRKELSLSERAIGTFGDGASSKNRK
jgi:hypothetical protein